MSKTVTNPLFSVCFAGQSMRNHLVTSRSCWYLFAVVFLLCSFRCAQTKGQLTILRHLIEGTVIECSFSFPSRTDKLSDILNERGREAERLLADGQCTKAAELYQDAICALRESDDEHVDDYLSRLLFNFALAKERCGDEVLCKCSSFIIVSPRCTH